MDDTDPRAELAALLLVLREKAGLTRAAVSEISGLSSNTLRRLEEAHPNCLCSLTDVHFLGCVVYELDAAALGGLTELARRARQSEPLPQLPNDLPPLPRYRHGHILSPEERASFRRLLDRYARAGVTQRQLAAATGRSQRNIGDLIVEERAQRGPT